MESYMLEINGKALILERVCWLLRLQWTDLTLHAIPSTFSLLFPIPNPSLSDII